MVSGPNSASNQLIEDRESQLFTQENDYLGNKWTYEEYLEELKKPIDYPNIHDKDDPGYYRKYAHNVPPP